MPPRKTKRSDGTTHTPKRSKKRPNANKHITKNFRGDMFVGLDVHKETVQIAAVDTAGELLFNKKIKNTFPDIAKATAKLPKKAKYVMESSSVWYGLYRYMSDELHLDVVLSNPYNTKIIAASLKKTDKIDAHKLANLLRGGYIATCYVPDKIAIQYRQLARHRNKVMRIRTKLKTFIHGITLQQGIKIKARPFSSAHIGALKKLGDYRINSYLEMIEFQTRQIYQADKMIKDIVSQNSQMKLLTTIPGVGPYTALTVLGEIADVKRFIGSHKLCAYAGIVPSVRNSADTVHHGHITKRGNSMLRWILTEAVHTHVQYAPNSDLTNFYKRLAKKRGTSKAAVAAASKLLRIIYWMLKENRGYVQCHT